MPDINLNGALILSRSGDGEDIPEKTLERFKIAIKEHGYDSEELLNFDNSGCDSEKFSEKQHHLFFL